MPDSAKAIQHRPRLGIPKSNAVRASLLAPVGEGTDRRLPEGCPSRLPRDPLFRTTPRHEWDGIPGRGFATSGQSELEVSFTRNQEAVGRLSVQKETWQWEHMPRQKALGERGESFFPCDPNFFPHKPPSHRPPGQPNRV